MPLKEFKCKLCNHVTESTIRNAQDLSDTKCDACGAGVNDLDEVKFYSSGLYLVKGDNSASQRPRPSKSTERK